MSLNGLFTPRSIAVYGASASGSRKLGNILLANAVSGAGNVVAVHPEAETIDGVAAMACLDRAVDLALISVPSHRVEAAVADAAAAGTKAGYRVVIRFWRDGCGRPRGAGPHRRAGARGRNAARRPQLHGGRQPPR